MATRRRRTKKKTAAPKRRRKRVRAVAAPRRRKHRRAKKAAKVTRRRRKTVRVEAKRSRRRRRVSTVMAAPRRRRRRVTRASEAWKGDKEGHAKAARKGHRRRKARKSAKKGHATRRAKRGQSPRVYSTTVAAPRRRRRHAREPMVMEAKRRRHSRRHMSASRGGRGMGPGAMALMVASGGVGFVLADGLDRLLATYNPSGATKPTDRFTSDGTGTLANTLNIASMPNWKRAVAGVGVAAVPAVGAMFVKNPYGRGALEGLAVGAGINAFKVLWQNVLMPLLIGKDTSPAALQKSYIARLYPAEVAASISKKQVPNASGVLSDQQKTDVGPYALGGDSPYPDAAEVLRKQTGTGGDSPYPSAADAFRRQAGMGGDSPYPSTAEALRKQAGMGGEAPCDDCGVGEPPKRINLYSGFVGEPVEESATG